MYLVAVGWMYVVLLMTVAEATGSNGSLLGALVTFVLYGVLPLSIVMYLLRTPARRRARRAAEAGSTSAGTVHGGAASDDKVAPVRREP